MTPEAAAEIAKIRRQKRRRSRRAKEKMLGDKRARAQTKARRRPVRGGAVALVAVEAVDRPARVVPAHHRVAVHLRENRGRRDAADGPVAADHRLAGGIPTRQAHLRAVLTTQALGYIQRIIRGQAAITRTVAGLDGSGTGCR